MSGGLRLWSNGCPGIEFDPAEPDVELLRPGRSPLLQLRIQHRADFDEPITAIRFSATLPIAGWKDPEPSASNAAGIRRKEHPHGTPGETG